MNRGGPRRFHRSRAAVFRRPWTLVLGIIISAEIIIWMGVATDWFGWGPAHGGSSPANGNGSVHSLNPFNESIQRVVAAIQYTGNLTGYFPAL
jgi:hypothetical protein